MKIIQNSNHKAVAPIIATLLMVAIAVVGGILIFVFTQGFFADEQVVGPTVDNIRIFGYDARDGGNNLVQNHKGNVLTHTGTESNSLQTGDAIAIYVENLGDKPVAFNSARVFGLTYPSATTCSAENHSLFTGDTPVNDSILDPNEQGTICILYDGNVVKPGRTIPIQIETSNGQSSQINIINGAVRGQQ